MEEKLKRESREFVQKQFKKFDRNGAAAIHRNDMIKILTTVLPEYNQAIEKLEMEELLKQHVKVTKYTQHNKATNQFEVKYQDDTLDFPSVLAIVVHFLMKSERKNSNAFAGQSNVRFTDFPAGSKVLVNTSTENKKRMF